MKSSAQELWDAVMDLTAHDGPDSCSMFAFSAHEAHDIARITENVNQGLTEAWTKASDVFNQLDEKINEVMKTLYEHMRQFSYDTVEGEAKVTEATEEANQTGDDVLSELDDIHV